MRRLTLMFAWMLLLATGVAAPVAAGLAWTATGEAPPPVALAGGTRLSAPFASNRAGRFSWDAPLEADMRAMAGVRFRVRCPDVSAVTRFFIYFKSGAGWYGTVFTPRGGDWETLEVTKTGTFVEGRAEGWARITGVRLALARAGARNAVLEVADFAMIPNPSRVAVVRGTSALGKLGTNEARGVTDFPDRILKALGGLGVTPLLLEDVDILDGFLERQHVGVVLLPYNPGMPEPVSRKLVKYVNKGGHLVGFFTPAAGIAAALGLQVGNYVMATSVPDGLGGIQVSPGLLRGAPEAVPQASWMLQSLQPVPGRGRVVATWYSQSGKATGLPAVLLTPEAIWMTHCYLNAEPERGSRLLLAMIGQFMPEVWQEAAAGAVARLDRERVAAGSGAAAGLRAALAQVLAAEEAARTLAARGDYLQAIDKTDAGRKLLQAAIVAAQPSVEGEFRGAWCHRGYGIQGWTWDQTVQHLKACGFNALFANMAWAGKCSYKSRVLPADATMRLQGDQLKSCAAACAREGVQLHVWICCFNLGDGLDPEHLAMLRKTGRLQQNSAGKVNERWMCPSNPENRQLLLEAIAEILKNYDVAGIHLDFIRYPDQDHCFCPDCRRRFEAALGRRVANWPGDVVANPVLQNAWLDYRRRIISSFVSEARQAVRKSKRVASLSAAVFDNFNSARNAVGQDWVAWCRQGDVDFVAPMTYTADLQFFTQAVQQQTAAVKGTGVRLFPGIGLRSAGLDAVGVVQQIGISRRFNTGGFMIFEYNIDEATRIFPELAKGATRPR